ncbi:uncharacterized protein LOC585161 [Strongylocentrotus purpuratus]|uniref:Glyoxylate reductase/hydroxypyruvate reductase n=1 Tax=Strongylocentrotus purpuratus TaxID=7668 RepID=A0A7M7HIY2_STRPU|nr:uncharacterized protein LOC585161 [Strongylocentrotus purpuratus]XP_011672067.2 uncharacterized protein LOC585161 [Strongylocentrotus purpuratus]XP_011672068.2 uncharacterized protein LOC585161 [Strongylocentrotus purpuratus]
MASNSERKPAWVLVTIPKAYHPSLKLTEAMHEMYQVIHWEEFSSAVDQYAAKVDAMLVTPSGTPKLSPGLLDRMVNLKAVVTASSGTDHLDLALLRKYNIKVYNAGGVNSDACADMVFNLLLSIARRNTEVIQLAHRFAAQSKVVVEQIMQVLGHEVTSSTLGIVGMGSIGYEVARRAVGFKMKTLYYSRSRRTAAEEDEVKATYCSSMDDLLPHVDFLVLSLPLTEETRHIMGKHQFNKMKSNAILINVARGELVDHDDLTDALRSGTIAGAGLDLTEPYPLPSGHPLLKMPNVIITPHCSALTVDMGKKMMQRMMDNLSEAIPKD